MRGRGCRERRRRGMGCDGTTPVAGRRRGGKGSGGEGKEKDRGVWRRRWRRWGRANDMASLAGLSTAGTTRWPVREHRSRGR
jgi:hypothetical protein